MYQSPIIRAGMSSDVVIRVENVAKKYTIRHFNGLSRDGLRHALQKAVTAPFRALNHKLRGADTSLNGKGVRVSSIQNLASNLSGSQNRETFWALKNVSFDVKRGEVVGIIGRNGAGKSTLLKILSRITEPTLGRIGIKGRVASLLEVGTGFHQRINRTREHFSQWCDLGHDPTWK